MASSIKRQYINFAGVDFTNDASVVNLNRSPDAVNVYKNYSSTQGNCIETRPGYRLLHCFNEKINGMFFISSSSVLVHSGTNLILWNNFPSVPSSPTILKSNMNNAKSCFFTFNDNVYINDGANFLVYDKNELKDVCDIAYIPTTSIARSPSGGGEILDDVNLLQPKRKNKFISDGTSTDYYLDAQDIDNTAIKVTVDDVLKVEGTDFTVDRLNGKVSFVTAPAKTSISSQDNVVIEFSKEIEGYKERILKSKISLVFDNRVFFSGCSDYPNALFHSKLNNPTYVSDLNYYQDGSDSSAIKSLCIGNNILWVFKEENQQNATVFYHTPTLDTVNGKIYPSQQGNISTGCFSSSCNFSDDIVFMSRYGLEGITGNISDKQLLGHRSSLVDNKLINSNNFQDCIMQEWNGYLLCLVDGQIFLADSRQKYQGINGFEYEWYYWNNIGTNNGKAIVLKEYKGELYFGCEDGSIFLLDGTNDNGEILHSYWTTPMDNFGYGNVLKTTNKRGGIAKIKTIPNGQIKIAEKTNKKEERYITTKSSTGFDYSNFDYSNFAYTTTNESYIVYKIKEKKFIELMLKFYSDELDKPFGIYSATIEVFIGGYVKR